MAKTRKSYDVWFVSANTVYRAVPYNIVTDWIQQGRLTRNDQLRLSGDKNWTLLTDMPDLSVYLSADDETAYFDDNAFYLRGRVRRLTSGVSWSEEPPSRTRRLITNVRVRPLEDGALEAVSNFYVYRSRLERHQDWFVGERFDVLRPADTAEAEYPFVIASRKVVLDQATLLAPSISILL